MKIAIGTTFSKSRPEYALYHVVMEQAQALAAPGNDVDILVLQNYEQTEPIPPSFKAHFRAVLPVPSKPLIDYKEQGKITPEHKLYSSELSSYFKEHFGKYDVVMTHDWVFTGWNLPFWMALKDSATQLKKIKFLHWIHSIPGLAHDWWYLRLLGEENHRLVYPNKVERLRVANFYNCSVDKVLYIPHVVDLRGLLHFSERTCDYLGKHPEIISSSIVQIYPASSDRLDAKGVRDLIVLFSKIKNRGFPVCLVIVNGNATTKERFKKVDHFKKIAKRCGLVPDEDILFTSDEADFAQGVPKKILSELMMYSTVFIFPTRQETFGLVMPEACLLSGAFPVVNKSLNCLLEVSEGHGLLADFGSYYQKWSPKSENEWLEGLAGHILSMYKSNDSVQMRNHVLRHFSREAVYDHYYVPILEGSSLW